MESDQQSNEIQLEIDAPIATITINRADDENRLTRANLERLGKIAEILNSANDVQAVLVTGSGDDFSPPACSTR